MENKDIGKNKKREKMIFFGVRYIYPEEQSDEFILDRFAAQILNDASSVNKDDIRIVIQDDREVHCPKCGYLLRGVSREIEVYKGLGITEYELYCDECDIIISVEDRSSFEQEGKIIITFS